MEDSQVAAALSTQLAERIGQQRFDLWFNLQARLCVRGASLTIQRLVRSCAIGCEANLRMIFVLCWESLVGDIGTIEFELDLALPGAPGTSRHCGSSSEGTAVAPPKSVATSCFCGRSGGTGRPNRRTAECGAGGFCRRPEQRIRISSGRIDGAWPATGIALVALRPDGRRQNALAEGDSCRSIVSIIRGQRRCILRRSSSRRALSRRFAAAACRASARSAAGRSCWQSTICNSLPASSGRSKNCCTRSIRWRPRGGSSCSPAIETWPNYER